MVNYSTSDHYMSDHSCKYT